MSFRAALDVERAILDKKNLGNSLKVGNFAAVQNEINNLK